MVLLSLSILSTSLSGLFLLSLLYTFIFLHLRLPFLSLIRQLRFFFLLLVIVFILRTVSIPGDELIRIFGITMTVEGLHDGFLVCWRLFLVVLVSFIFVATSRISSIKYAVQKLLTPIPFIPAKRLSTMMGLIVRFIPVIFQKARNVADAQKARCVELRKNPLYRLENLCMPLMRGVFQDADKLAMAMMARCYDEKQQLTALPIKKIDWIVSVAGGLFCLMLFFL